MMNRLLLSIITVGLDELEIIETLYPLKSFLNLSSVESIVITPTITEYLKDALPCSVFISDPGSGVYPAMNEGLSFASGSYVWYLNAGDQSLINQDDAPLLLQMLANVDKVRNLPVIFFDSKFLGSEKSSCFNQFFLKLSLLTLGMPVSHQNVLIPSSIHQPFSGKYLYSSDFFLLSDLIFMRNCSFILKQSRLARLSPGGISDSNRFSVFSERYRIMTSSFPYFFTPFFFVFCFFRVFREFLASNLKKFLRIPNYHI